MSQQERKQMIQNTCKIFLFFFQTLESIATDQNSVGQNQFSSTWWSQSGANTDQQDPSYNRGCKLKIRSAKR